MRIKSFIASTVQEALKSVKREMGDASIILETRDIEEGDIKSKTGQTLVEVIAAENSNLPGEDQDSDQDEEQKDGQERRDVQDNSVDSELELPDQNPSDISNSEPQLSKQYSASTEHEDASEGRMDNITLTDHLHSDKQDEPTDSTPADRLGDFTVETSSGEVKQVSKWIVDSKVENSIPHVDHDINNNGDNLKRVSSVLNQTESSSSGWLPSERYTSVKKQESLPRSEKDDVPLSEHLLAEDLNEIAGYSADGISDTFDYLQNCDYNSDWSETSEKLFKQLLLQQVEEEHSTLLINDVVSRLSNDEYDKIDLNLQMLREGIIHKIRIPELISLTQDECKTMVFVGSAGTGKTSTILKLASDMRRKSDKEILLISIRGHSAEKLKKTAGRIGATLSTVTSHRELREIIEKNEGFSHIFIDTPGIGYSDDNALSGVKGFLDEIPNKETHLVVSAATRYADIINIVNKFTLFPLDRLHFTKVDETCLYGTLLSVAMETQIPLSSYSDGQEIPEDLRPVTAELVADMVLQV